MEKKELKVGDKVRIVSNEQQPKYNGKIGVIHEVMQMSDKPEYPYKIIQGYKVRIGGKVLKGVALASNLELAND
nr:hypothetical protein [uncultured Prevotella sp.]